MDERPSSTILAFRYLVGGVALPSLALTRGIANTLRPGLLEGKSILHSVAAMGIPCAAEALCAMGADPNKEDSLGGTPLGYAILTAAIRQPFWLSMGRTLANQHLRHRNEWPEF
jgi:hypothetical protein